MLKFSALRHAAVVASLALPLSLPAVAADWTVDPARSSLAFVATQNGAPVTGQFTDWSAAIAFDPADLSAARIEARVRTASARTGQAQIDGTLPGAAWFNAAAVPEAVFTASSIRETGSNAYEATGELAIRGAALPLVLPFTLEIDGDTARARAEVVVGRLSYGIGADIPSSTVADDVRVVLDLVATR